jgi:predicted enzyme related to lactoylglutathione lyase
MSNPVGWFEISVRDMKRAKAFYEGVFGAQLSKIDTPGNEMWSFPMDNNSYGTTGCLSLVADAPLGRQGTLVYFSCTDCAVEAARAPQHGGRIAQGKTSIGPHGFFALLTDPDGNTIGLHSMQ